MSQMKELLITFNSEWENIKKSLLEFADQVYGMGTEERRTKIVQLLELLQDINKLFILISNDDTFSSVIKNRDNELHQVIVQLQELIQNEMYFELGELIRYEYVSIMDQFKSEVEQCVH